MNELENERWTDLESAIGTVLNKLDRIEEKTQGFVVYFVYPAGGGDWDIFPEIPKVDQWVQRGTTERGKDLEDWYDWAGEYRVKEIVWRYGGILHGDPDGFHAWCILDEYREAGWAG